MISNEFVILTNEIKQQLKKRGIELVKIEDVYQIQTVMGETNISLKEIKEYSLSNYDENETDPEEWIYNYALDHVDEGFVLIRHFLVKVDDDVDIHELDMELMIHLAQFAAINHYPMKKEAMLINIRKA